MLLNLSFFLTVIFDHLYFSFVKSVFIFFAQFWIGITFFSDFIRTLNILFYAVIHCHILHFYHTFQLYYALLTHNLQNFWESFIWVFLNDKNDLYLLHFDNCFLWFLLIFLWQYFFYHTIWYSWYLNILWRWKSNLLFSQPLNRVFWNHIPVIWYVTFILVTKLCVIMSVSGLCIVFHCSACPCSSTTLS